MTTTPIWPKRPQQRIQLKGDYFGACATFAETLTTNNYCISITSILDRFAIFFYWPHFHPLKCSTWGKYKLIQISISNKMISNKTQSLFNLLLLVLLWLLMWLLLLSMLWFLCWEMLLVMFIRLLSCWLTQFRSCRNPVSIHFVR